MELRNTLVDVLALDLEGTLISNALSQIPRPFLREFLEFCRGFAPRVVLYTAVREEKCREVARNLVREGSAPGWFDHVPCVVWTGPFKDLRFIPDADVERTLLLDDYEGCIHPDQSHRSVAVETFVAPYSSADRELLRIRGLLEAGQGVGPQRGSGGAPSSLARS